VDVYLGRQPLEATILEPGPLQWNTTYYWRIDEVNDAHPESPWIGPVWSFTVADFIVVDDFESYADGVGGRIFQTWIDGLGFTEPAPGNPGNGTSSMVGNISPPFAEQTVVYGGAQSMPMDYNNLNSPWFSEASRTWPSPQDWTVNEVKALTVHFRGHPIRFAESAPGQIVMSAAGTDIWDTADELRFAYKRLRGDGSITAKVESLANTHGWAKAGVMIRESLEPGAKHAYMVVTPDNGVSFGRRPFANDVSESTTERGGIAAPHWVRLTREGDTLTAQHSADGVTWVDANEPGNPTAVDIPMVGDVFIGLALTSHSPGNVTVARFSNVDTTGAVGHWQVADVGVAQPGNLADPLYLVVEDGAGRMAMVAHPDPDAVLLDAWQEWNIALAEFEDAGVDLRAIQAMHIGVGDSINPQPGGFGRIYIDEIRVHKPRCVPSIVKPVYDLNDDCLVGYLDLELMAQQWLAAGPQDAAPAADVNGDGRVNIPDFARLADTWMDEVLWP
jgi:regulation of enolase protein 1 (concanavalin A-like superfamily)